MESLSTGLGVQWGLPHMTPAQAIEARLEETRRQLLDLSRRNRLLNHKKTSRSALALVDELPDQVFQILVGKGKTMQFKSLEEAPQDSPVHGLAPEQPELEQLEGEHGPDLPLAPIDTRQTPAERHTDKYLQTELDGVLLQKRLVRLARNARSALQEQGCNILYLTLGLVEWREPGDDRACLAPLVFVPVSLERASVNSRYNLRRLDEDVICNPCLVELCQRQFAVALPVMEIDEDFELPHYFEAIAQAIAGFQDWRLLPEITLGCFSFAKFLMYRDLDPEVWPAGQALADHALVRQLSGLHDTEQAEPDALPDPRALDALVPPRECLQVMDADASQQVAVLAAKQGLSLVIEGPPGTGKSQTITNIIAELLGAQKTVLFVAEKAAALEVVKRRLTTVGLGEFVLELHSRKTSKAAVLGELRRTLELSPKRTSAQIPDDTALRQHRDRLNATVRELHDPLGELKISPFEAISRSVALLGRPEAHCRIPGLLDWSASQLGQAESDLDTLDRRLERVGDPSTHAWRHVRLVAAPLTVRQMLEEQREALARAIATLSEAAKALAVKLGLPAPGTPAALAELIDASREIVAAPVIPAEVLNHLGWRREMGRADWLEAGARYAKHRAVWSEQLIDEAENVQWREVQMRRRSQHASFLRWLRPSWYADSKRIRQHQRQGLLPAVGVQLELLDALVESARERNQVTAGEHRHAAPFCDLWQGADSDWEALTQLADSVPKIRARIEAGTLEQAATEAILTSGNRSPLTLAQQRASQAAQAAETVWQAWLEGISTEAEQWIGATWQAVSLSDVAARLDEIAEGAGSLQDWVDYCAVRQPLREGPIAAFLAWAESPKGEPARGQLGKTFIRHFYRLWIDTAFGQRKILGEFRGEDQRALIDRFARADRGWIKGMRSRLAAMIRAHRPDMSYAAHKTSKLGIVQAEIRKKRRHMPLRRLLNSAGEVIQAIKPCFMMSPISVAQYLEPGGLKFDVVIFDEASQVEPADAYGAIARGQQLILVGDENQLPPTSFFSKAVVDRGPATDEEVAASDLESVLSLGIVRLPHRCRLRWHYRSRHESLISFSNTEFYEGDLRIFPSPHTGCEVMGLAFVHVPDGVYMRGQGQHNPIEAAAVARAVIEHARASPDLSLGVGAFSVAQQGAIEDEIERQRREQDDRQVEAFFAGHADEPFFVKNLETIQGDERDVILLSVGYGPDQQRKLTMNFGPLNREGGWRRLNVLVTRSRRRCVCFSSITSDDIDTNRTSAPGVVALKRYLYAAEHGQLIERAAEDEGPGLVAFQKDLREALEAAGWKIRPFVGVGSFAIDLAVIDPDHTERYLVGIECDGEAYRSVFTARDRDRLRTQVLEALGWHITRVWSTDWFNRREQTLAELLALLNNARRAPRRYEEIAPAPLSPRPAPVEEPVDFGAAPEPAAAAQNELVPYYRRTRKKLGDHKALVAAPTQTVVGLIGDMVADEAPVHVDEVLSVITGLYRTRATKRPRAIFEEALEIALERGVALRKGDFLWRSLDQAIPVRSRDGDCPVTRAEFIAPEELAAAVKIVVGRAFGIKQDALVESTSKLLGYSRRGKSLTAGIQGAIALLHKTGTIAADEQGFIKLAE